MLPGSTPQHSARYPSRVTSTVVFPLPGIPMRMMFRSRWFTVRSTRSKASSPITVPVNCSLERLA